MTEKTSHKQFCSKTVGVFFGGRSPEHDVSILTGMVVMDELEKLKIPYEPIYISTDGSWCLGPELKDRSFLRNIHTKNIYSLQRWSIDTRHREPKLLLTRRPHFFSRRLRKAIDIAFPAFHGTFGEDGSFQGLCEMLNVPYVGCEVLTSAVSMDKITTKRIAESVGIEVTPFVSFLKKEWETDDRKIISAIGQKCTYPIFVKPSHAGSSIGVTKVTDKDKLKEAVNLAFTFDSLCVIETAVEPIRDLTCCVRQDRTGLHVTSEVQESVFTGSDFFTYEEKYLNDGGSQLGNAETNIVIPADISDTVKEDIQNITRKMASILYISGIARIDFLFNPDSRSLYLNEINPLPGTLYLHLWKKSGTEAQALILDLLQNALEDGLERSKRARYFPSELLRFGSGTKL